MFDQTIRFRAAPRTVTLFMLCGMVSSLALAQDLLSRARFNRHERHASGGGVAIVRWRTQTSAHLEVNQTQTQQRWREQHRRLRLTARRDAFHNPFDYRGEPSRRAFARASISTRIFTEVGFSPVVAKSR